MSTRKFSSTMLDTNSAYITSSRENNHQPVQQLHIGFILLEHFSMMSFTAAVDVLVTANLIQTDTLFKVSSYALEGTSITSDLGIDITTSGKLADITSQSNRPLTEALTSANAEQTLPLDILVVCGGLRCTLTDNPVLKHLLKSAYTQKITLGSIWNGVIALAQAGLIKNQSCALHMDNHPLIHEHYPNIKLSDKSYVISEALISCADALGALDMMLDLVKTVNGPHVSRAVKEILSCNRSREGNSERLIQFGDHQQLPNILRSAIELMNSNIEEPISIDDLAKYHHANRRQLERLFKQYLDTSPSRHYLEIRLTYARRLLVQSRDSITSVALACGFVSSNHFSNCFSQYFKMPPSACRKRKANENK